MKAAQIDALNISFRLRLWLVVAVITLFLPTLLPAQQTAYDAIEAVKKAKTSEAATRFLEIRGVQGATQPLVWVVAVEDPLARGGFREFEVSDGRILSERTPVRPGEQRPPLVPINMSLLNMDSDGAFIAANNIAKEMQVSFDSANYRLYARDPQGSPAWVVQLIDWDGTVDATVEVAATDGSILRASRESSNNDLSATTPAGQQQEGAIVKTGRTLEKAGRATRRTFWKGAASVEEWLTGRRTLDEGVE